ncbi:hypothetical protein [Peribacillus loiseleuriae]|uniref:hypothetical protein n=1 Tax=Peribacillus loiseleuriae TaxID=1679170 RepID=UPI003D05C65B
MHLRQFVLSGLIVGAALFFPTNAFADKANFVQKQPVKNEKATEKVTDVQQQVNRNENPASHNQVKIVRKSSEKKTPAVTHSSESGSAKPAQMAKPLPEQASILAKTASQATKKNVKQVSKVTLPERAATNPGEKKGLIKRVDQFVNNKNPVKQDVDEKTVVTEKSSEELLHSIEPEEKTKHQASKAVKPTNESKHKPVPNKKSTTKKVAIVGGSDSPKEKNTSSPVESIPLEKQAITPTQANYNSGGASNDRIIVGHSSMSFTDKWLDWEHY